MERVDLDLEDRGELEILHQHLQAKEIMGEPLQILRHIQVAVVGEQPQQELLVLDLNVVQVVTEPLRPFLEPVQPMLAVAVVAFIQMEEQLED